MQVMLHCWFVISVKAFVLSMLWCWLRGVVGKRCSSIGNIGWGTTPFHLMDASSLVSIPRDHHLQFQFLSGRASWLSLVENMCRTLAKSSNPCVMNYSWLMIRTEDQRLDDFASVRSITAFLKGPIMSQNHGSWIGPLKRVMWQIILNHYNVWDLGQMKELSKTFSQSQNMYTMWY